MRGFMIKSAGSKLLMFFALVMAVCFTARAETGDKDSQNSEVMTTLEQRMQKRISVDFRDTPIEDVIRIMADQADVDIVKSPMVTGNVTATLTNVPLVEALNNILAAHGYGYIASKNMIRIAPVGEITDKDEMLVSRIYRITYADVSEVEKALQKFLSKRGSLSSNPGSSNIIVTDAESKIKAIDTFISEIDRITSQILVEARIYDITSKDKLDLGVEWQAGRDTAYTSSGAEAYGTSRITTIGGNPTRDRDPFITGTFTGATAKTEGTTGALRFGWLNSGIDIDMLLKAQQNKINAKLLANPRVLVLDNETAEIKIISEVPYIELTETSAGGSMGTTNFREIGVTLKVTPHFTRDGMIRLRLKPEFSVQTGTVNVGSGNTQYPQPIVDRRAADTTLLVQSGQTVVLGGLRKKDVTKQINKIPFLGDLPLAGILFRFEGEDTITSELVVFVTPKIIEQSALSETESQQYKATEFSEPKPDFTRAEKTEKDGK